MNTILDFKELYPNLSPYSLKVFDDLVNIFTDFSKLESYLSLLENEVIKTSSENIMEQTFHFNEKGVSIPDDELEITLRKRELEYGFSKDIEYFPSQEIGVGEGGNKVAKPYFQSVIRSHKVFYDFGASRIHGEITHRLQLYILLNYLSNNFTIPSQDLPVPATTIYEIPVDDSNSRMYKRNAETEPYLKYLWNDVFDYGNLKMYDARSPLWLNTELVKGRFANSFPHISNSLRKKFTARDGVL